MIVAPSFLAAEPWDKTLPPWRGGISGPVPVPGSSGRQPSSPKPCTVLSTPGGRPASRQISDSSVAVSGLHSAGLCTTVQPAANAGAIFQVDSMNGVFQGVMTPTGPIG